MRGLLLMSCRIVEQLVDKPYITIYDVVLNTKGDAEYEEEI